MKIFFSLLTFALLIGSSFAKESVEKGRSPASVSCIKCVAKDRQYQAVCDSTKAMTNYGMDAEQACNVQAAFCEYKTYQIQGGCVAKNPADQAVCNTTRTMTNYGMSPEQACNVQAYFCEYKQPECH